MHDWINRYFFCPTPSQKIIAHLLWPISLLYCAVATCQRTSKKKATFPVPIISVGNLTVGGSGKTPFTIALASRYPNSCIILRGYGRKSKGLHVISHNGKILEDVHNSGDEAMLYAISLSDCSVIVSENRIDGIRQAINLGCARVFLDDAFRHPIQKFDILLKTEKKPFFDFCLPAGAYRESPSAYNEADLVAEEGIDFTRHVHIENPGEKMLLVTAIANPERLDPYLPENVTAKSTYADHCYFDETEIIKSMQIHGADSILTTEKDAVKMKGFAVPLTVMRLNLTLTEDTISRIDTYLNGSHT